MKVSSVIETPLNSGSIVTIGTFDGVHIGHQKIIKKLVDLGKEKDLQSVLLTFFPHPRMVIHKDSEIKLLNTLKEKSIILEANGLDHLVIKEFTPEFSRFTALEFVRDILVNALKTKCIIIGYDHRFGRNRAANIDDLKDFGQIYDFEVIQISAEEINEVAVSSTKIRKALESGDLKTANVYLGYPYMLTGTVVSGKGLGRELDFPTANLQIAESFKLIPKNGVYAVKSEIDGDNIYGMMNIGVNPTVNENSDQNIEIHFFDFDKDIYGQELQIDVLVRLRDERKFDSLDALKSQLDIDQQNAKEQIKSL